jgi:phosphoglycolate phosphatase-like HAD superfamily hydrolase
MRPPNPDAKLWLFDFDNTLAALEREVDWPGSRRELEAWLRTEGVNEEIFAEIPKGNLPLYAALQSRWLRAPLAAPRAASAIPPPAAAPLGAAARTAVMPPARAEAILRHASEIIERHELVGAERAAPTPGAIELLRAIAARGAVAIIVTSNSTRTVAQWLDRHRVGDLVRAIVGRDSLLALKPSPEMIVRALDRAATFPADAFAAIPAAAATMASAADALTAIPAAEIHLTVSADATPTTVSADAALATMSAADAVFVGDSLADFEAARAARLGFYGIAATESARDRLITAGATDIFASPAALRIHLNLAPPEPASDSDPN